MAPRQEPDVTDLHTRLHTTITARLDTARAAADATPPPWTYVEEYPRLRDGRGNVIARFGYLDGRYIALHDPADAIRRYQRDLQVLERHTNSTYGGCDVCTSPSGFSEDWPCVEIDDLATVYPEASDRSRT